MENSDWGRMKRDCKFSENSKMQLSFFMVLISIVIFSVLFNEPHMGAANNGDFWRLAERVGIGNIEQLEEDENPYWDKLFEKWTWEPMPWKNLTPEKASFSNIWLISFIRLVTNIFSDTNSTSFHTFYLAMVYAALLWVACWLLLKLYIFRMKNFSPYVILAAATMFLGSMHLAWFNSFYGEAMLYVGLILSLAFMLTAAMEDRGSLRGKVMLILSFAASYLFLCGKLQNVLAYPFWMLVLIFLTIYVCGEKRDSQKKDRILSVICIVLLCFHIVWTGLSCFRLYQWNAERNEKETIISAVLDGILMLTEEPEKLLEDLGLDPVLAQDKGKSAYWDPEDMYAPPYSERAQEMIYDKIDTIKLLKYYIMHPEYLYKALDITAGHAIQPATRLHRFAGEAQTFGIGENGRFTLWENIRPWLVPHYFWQYVIIYILLVGVSVRSFLSGSRRKKCCILIYLLVLITGVIQFPMPFLGNGYADTNKQLYLFMLTYDIAIFVGISWLFYKLCQFIRTHKKQTVSCKTQ